VTAPASARLELEAAAARISRNRKKTKRELFPRSDIIRLQGSGWKNPKFQASRLINKAVKQT
jgi:hypothetical protein